MRDSFASIRARLRRARPEPPRPRLCPGVKLRGPMTESAFAIQPWLVERNGRFIQLTELLYRIAQCADGTRSIEHIAADCGITPDAVRQLLVSRLVPAGILTMESDPVKPATARAAAPRSPLALNVRMAVVPLGVIDALTRIFQYLYAPPLLLLMLFLTLQAQYWLLAVHGVTASITQALSTPATIPLVVALMIASAAFHELGHAAALRYGGGSVRGMGFGFYLMYPALYTDVSDNYRLGRWARVRTDLGGFYFNLLFSLGLMGVYHVTGQEYLLLVALLTNIEIIHQCLPFVRLDGYWALADLTGVPDFLSFMGAYVRSVLPFGHWKGRKLPRLKWWAKAVFAAYIAVCVPAMLVLVTSMVSAAPRVMTAAWETGRQKLAEVAAAQAYGDLAAVGSAELQLLLLLLPAVGLAVMLLTLARTLALLLWRWGRPTRARRLASCVVAAGVLGALVYVWSPASARMAIAASILPPGRTAVPTVTPEPRPAAATLMLTTTVPTDTPAATALATEAPAATPTEVSTSTPAPMLSASASPTHASATAAPTQPSEPSATAVWAPPSATPVPSRAEPTPARASVAPAPAVPRPTVAPTADTTPDQPDPADGVDPTATAAAAPTPSAIAAASTANATAVTSASATPRAAPSASPSAATPANPPPANPGSSVAASPAPSPSAIRR